MGEAAMSTADKLREEGILLDKQEVLIRLISNKFGITGEERHLINSGNDLMKLDQALDEILFAA